MHRVLDHAGQVARTLRAEQVARDAADGLTDRLRAPDILARQGADAEQATAQEVLTHGHGVRHDGVDHLRAVCLRHRLPAAVPRVGHQQQPARFQHRDAGMVRLQLGALVRCDSPVRVAALDEGIRERLHQPMLARLGRLRLTERLNNAVTTHDSLRDDLRLAAFPERAARVVDRGAGVDERLHGGAVRHRRLTQRVEAVDAVALGLDSGQTHGVGAHRLCDRMRDRRGRLDDLRHRRGWRWRRLALAAARAVRRQVRQVPVNGLRYTHESCLLVRADCHYRQLDRFPIGDARESFNLVLDALHSVDCRLD